MLTQVFLVRADIDLDKEDLSRSGSRRLWSTLDQFPDLSYKYSIKTKISLFNFFLYLNIDYICPENKRFTSGVNIF